MQPAEQLGYLIHHLSFVLDRQSDQVLSERLGVGFSQFKILMTLKWHTGVRQRFIAEYLGQTEASISRQLKLLQGRGLIERSVSPANRRERTVRLTPRGLRIIDESFSVLNVYHAPVFGQLSEKQRILFLEMLLALHQETCKGTKPGRCFQQG